MKTCFNRTRRPLVWIIMIIFLATSLYTNQVEVKAEDGTNFIDVTATAEEVSGTEFRRSNVNGADFVITRDGNKETRFGSSSIGGTDWTQLGSFWQLQFSTKGYKDLSIAYNVRSSGTGPAHFCIQYKNGENFDTVDNSAYTITSTSLRNQMGGSIRLPAVLNDSDTVILRIATTDLVSQKGGTVASGGTSNINNIVVTGTKCSSGDPEPDPEPQLTNNITASITADPGTGAVNPSDPITLSVADVKTVSGSSVTVVSGGALQVVSGSSVTLNPENYKLMYQVNDGTPAEYSAPIVVENLSGDTFKIKAYAETSDTKSTAVEFAYTIVRGDFVDIATARAGTEGTNYKIKGRVSFIDGKNVYIQDDTGGINVYCSTAYPIEPGNEVMAYGIKSNYNGLEQLGNGILYHIDTSTTMPYPAIEINNIADFIQNYNAYECTSVKLEDMLISEVSAQGDIYVQDPAGNQIKIYKGAKAVTWAVKKGDIVQVIAVVSDYNGLQLRMGKYCSILKSLADAVSIEDIKTQKMVGSDVILHGAVNYYDGNEVIIEDETGVMKARLLSPNSAITTGKYIQVFGTLKEEDSVKYVEAKNDGIRLYNNFDAYLKEVTIADLLANPSQYVYKRVEVQEAILGDIDEQRNTTLTQGGASITVKNLPNQHALVKGAEVSLQATGLLEEGTFSLYITSENDIKIKQPVDPIYDPIGDELFTDGALNIAQVNQSGADSVTVIGQVVVKYGSKGTLDSIILEDVIQNEIVGLQIYDKANISQYKIGDIVKVTGTRSKYGEVTQLSNTTVTVLQENVETIAPQTVTIAQLKEGKDQYLSEYVRINGVTLGAYNENNTKITDSTGEVNIYRAAPYDKVVQGDVVELYGVWSKYNTTYQLRVGQSDCYLVQGRYPVDDSIVLPLVSWGGTSPNGYSSATIYGDLNQLNDQADQSAKLTVSTGAVPQYSYTVDGVAQYCIGSKGLLDGQYYQNTFETKGYGSLDLSFTMRGSNTGAKYFKVLYSTDGVNFVESNQITYSISTKNWTTGETTKTDYTNQRKLEVTTENVDYYVELPDALNHCDQVYIRLQVAGSTSIKGETIQNTGVNRLTNIAYTASPVVSDSICQVVTITPDAGAVGLNSELTMLTKTVGASIYYKINDGEYQLYDSNQKPVLTTLPADVTVYAKKDGIENSIIVTYGYTQAKVNPVKASPNGGAVKLDTAVKLTCATEGTSIVYSTDKGATWLNYTSSIKLAELPATIMAKATKAGYLDSEVMTFEYTKRLNDEYNIYFGQIHSHTEYSDGAGTCEQAFQYASTEAENIDFLAVTDHSNSFDHDTSATIKDGSASTEWLEGHALADKYTKTDGDHPFVGIYGYEMTWSGGAPGHMNTYNTDGFLSRTMTGFTNGSAQSLPNYYNQLKTVPDSFSMFNHPGSTFGDFYDFGYYDEEIDSLITLIEVGNGEGAIGSSGYFPSYEYYTRALDKGWHVAPTNNQDNHKGVWGDANTGRTVVLADSLTRENIYDALRNMRAYATEDADLSIWYTLNGMDMGTIFEETPDEVEIQVKLVDPTDSSIGKVDVVVNGGLTVATKTVTTSEGTVDFDLKPEYSYYYIRVTQADGNLAVTAPVWISEVEAVGISSITTTASLAVAGEPIDVTTTLYNNEQTDFAVHSIVYTVNGEVIRTTDVAAANLSVIQSQKTASETFLYTHNGLGKTEIMVTVLGTLNGVAKQYTSVLQLNYVSPDMVTRVLVDGTHNNDYVNGYYGGNVGNFADLASDDYAQVTVVTDKFTKEMLEDCSLLIISAPAKKSGTYNNQAYGVGHFEDDFLQMVKEYVDAGGNLVVCGLADYQDSKDGQSSTELNRLLEAISATMRINSDEVVDDENNGGQTYRLYFDDFNRTSKYLNGVTDEQLYSFYSGCSVLLDPAAVAAGTSEALVWGHDTTYSFDSKKFDSNYVAVEKGSMVALGHETLSSGSELFVAGTVFLSDFEVKTDLDNASESYYANRNILLNLLKEVKKELPVSTIAQMRHGEAGQVFAIEGWVTAGTAVAGNTFFDTIYVQDETAGTTVFPVADAGIKIGTKLRIVGYVDEYQGDKEIQVIEYRILDSLNLKVIEPAVVTTKQAADYDTYGGSLLKVSGKVTRIVTNTSGVDYFYLMDNSGVEARVFIDGYILASDEADTINNDIKVGNEVSAIGLSYYNPDGACLRVRDRAEIVLIKEASTQHGEPSQNPVVTVLDKIITEIKNAIRKAAEGAGKENTVTIDLSTTGILSKDVLNLLLNTDLTVKIELGNGVTCKINSKDINTMCTKDIDLSVRFGEKIIPNNVITSKFGNLTSKLGMEQLSIQHDGEFGFPIAFTFDLSKITEGLEGDLYAGMYYYDHRNEQLILQSVSKVEKDHKATFIGNHASDYMIVVGNEIPVDTSMVEQVQFTDGSDPIQMYRGGTTGNVKQLNLQYPDILKEAMDKGIMSQKVKYTTSDKSVVMISRAGRMLAKGTGTAVIRATVTIQGETVVLERTVTVENAFIQIKAAAQMKVGEQLSTECIVHGYREEDIVWSTQKKKIVVVDKNNGKKQVMITGVSKGTDTLIVKVKKNVSAQCEIKVTE